MVGFKNDKFGVTPIFSNIDIDITYCFNTNLFQKQWNLTGANPFSLKSWIVP